MRYHILLTIDVEDWFQVENFKQWIPFSSWSSYKLRVEKNTHQLLDLLDSITLELPSFPASQPHSFHASPKATFFILGWLAERLPDLVREIHERGHEVASHGYKHQLCNQQSYNALQDDLEDSKKLLEDIIGSQIYGYRAPSFAINNNILKIIEDCGYVYDSSYNSFAMHERYGRLDLSKNENKGVAVKISNNFYELPISNLNIGKIVFPLGGGGYFRLIPLSIFKKGVKSILNNYKTYIFYMHPWEIDDLQPRVKNASRFYKFRHYVNLNKNASKLSSFIKYFSKSQFVTCHNYLTQIGWEARRL
jgi:polysaccharide deacetylase family protein (PEP-CTERM system associated)